MVLVGRPKKLRAVYIGQADLISQRYQFTRKPELNVSQHVHMAYCQLDILFEIVSFKLTMIENDDNRKVGVSEEED